MNKTGTQTIETERLLLRKLRVEDAQDMFENWASDPEVIKFMPWRVLENVDEARELIEYWAGDYFKDDYFNWAIVYKENDKVIGNIWVGQLNEWIEAADMACCLGRSYWNQGIMTEALMSVMDYLFDVVGVNRITGSRAANNPASGRIMEKAGMLYEGMLRSGGKNKDGICDVFLYGMLKNDRQ